MKVDDLFIKGVKLIRRPDWIKNKFVEIGEKRGLRTPESTMHEADGKTRQIGYWLLNGDDWEALKENGKTH